MYIISIILIIYEKLHASNSKFSKNKLTKIYKLFKTKKVKNPKIAVICKDAFDIDRLKMEFISTKLYDYIIFGINKSDFKNEDTVLIIISDNRNITIKKNGKNIFREKDLR